MAKVIILIILLINGIKTLDFESLEFKEITLTEENDIEFDIYPDETYKFISGREDYIYCFPEEFSYILNYSNNSILYPFPLEGEKIIIYFNCLFQAINISANYYKNLKNSVKIKISSIPYYEKISSLETINEDKVFFMWNNETEKKLQYFYSLDNNCKIYSNFKYIGDDENCYFSSNEFIYRIRDLPIIIKFKVYNTCSIIMQTFLIDNISNEKNINDEEAFFSIFYEQTTSIINFEGNRMNKMITLFGPKFFLKNETFNPKLVIYKDGIEIATLNKSQKYYKLDNNYNGKLTLIGETNEGFFCIYSFLSEGKSEILDDISLSNYQLVGNSVYIKLKKTQRSFRIQINSDNNIVYSLSTGISNTDNYYFPSKSLKMIHSKKKELFFEYLAPFKNTELSEDEFLYIKIDFKRDEKQQINISYYQFSEIDDLFEKK